MYNLNVNMASAANSLLSVDNTSTPRTPEIVNSLIAMTNPLDLQFGKESKCFNPTLSSDSNSSSCSQESRTTSTRPYGPTSVKKTCSQLIKAGLKLTIEQKRKRDPDDPLDLLDLDEVKRIKRNESESEEDKCHSNNGLTPEDEERRRRRRERNKIAATKCRLKKRERTANLIQESETLEAQNIDLKKQLQDLQNQSRSLTDMLSRHQATCQKNLTINITIEPPSFNQVMNSVIESNHSYNNRPASVDSNFHRTQLQDTYRPSSTGSYTYLRNNVQYNTPNITVESVNEEDNFTCFTDLDNPSETYSYNSQHNYQNYGSDPLRA